MKLPSIHAKQGYAHYAAKSRSHPPESWSMDSHSIGSRKSSLFFPDDVLYQSQILLQDILACTSDL